MKENKPKKIIEKGYAIKVIGYQRNGEIYKQGFVGDGFYVSSYEAELFSIKDEALDSLKAYRKDYNDGTVKFSLCTIHREITVFEEEE